MSLPRITDAFTCAPDCPVCHGCGTVCEAHPDRAWGGILESGCDCGAAGMPCRSTDGTFETKEDAIAAVLAGARASGEAVTCIVHARTCETGDGEDGCTCTPQVVEYDPAAARS